MWVKVLYTGFFFPFNLLEVLCVNICQTSRILLLQSCVYGLTQVPRKSHKLPVTSFVKKCPCQIRLPRVKSRKWELLLDTEKKIFGANGSLKYHTFNSESVWPILTDSNSHSNGIWPSLTHSIGFWLVLRDSDSFWYAWLNMNQNHLEYVNWVWNWVSQNQPECQNQSELVRRNKNQLG